MIGQLHLAFMQAIDRPCKIHSSDQINKGLLTPLISCHPSITCQLSVSPTDRSIDLKFFFFLPRQTAGRLDWTSPYAVRVVLPFISYTCVTLAGKHMAGLSYGDGDKEASISLSEHSA
jgi:hypothetical protein